MGTAKDRVLHVADSARPYVDRALQDDELRESVKKAFAAARDVYAEIGGSRGLTAVAARVATDREIQESLRTAVEELRRAAVRLQAPETHRSRNTLLLLTGIALAILFNPVTGPDTRRWLKDMLFGDGGGLGFEPASGNSGFAV